VIGESDPKKQRDAKRMARKRALEYARKNGFAFETLADETELVWQPSETNAGARFTARSASLLVG
jgi:hypothetical protein